MNKITVNLGGKERTLKFTMLTQELWEKLSIQHFSAEDFGEFSNNTQTIGKVGLASAIIVYAGLKAYADLTQTKPDFTLEDCLDWVEELMISEDDVVLKSIYDTWTASAAYKSRQELKKKMDEQIGMQSEGTPLVSLESDQSITTN